MHRVKICCDTALQGTAQLSRLTTGHAHPTKGYLPITEPQQQKGFAYDWYQTTSLMTVFS